MPIVGFGPRKAVGVHGAPWGLTAPGEFVSVIWRSHALRSGPVFLTSDVTTARAR
jgi:hypothetical protein